MADVKKQFQRSDVLAKARRRLGLESVSSAQDRAGLFSLTQLLYPHLDIHDPHYIAWQYDHNPSGSAYDRVGRVGGKTVGHYSVIPMRYKLGGATLKGSLSVNTMTHPAYRGKGIFMLLAEEVFQACQGDGVPFTLGFPNPNSYKGFLKHLDFKDIGSLPLWILPLELKSLIALGRAKSRFLPVLLKLAAPIWRLKLRTLTRPSVYAIRSVREIDESFNTFWETVKEGYRNLGVRDQRYLDWRFIKHPTRSYSVFSATSEGHLRGYIVTRKTTIQQIECGMIVDLLVPATKEGQRVAEDLIRFVSDGFAAEGLALAGCLAPRDSAAGAALRHIGYIRCPDRFLPQPFPVIARWHGPVPAPQDLFAFENWYLTMGDYDAV